MSRDEIFPESIVELAKRQLDCSASTSDHCTFQLYVAELEKHMRLYPNDINFCVRLSPGTGFGTATCYEEGCLGAEIPLVPRLGAPNGGIDIGLGSLSAYRAHISNTPVHEQSRNARVSRGEGFCPARGAKMTRAPFGQRVSSDRTVHPPLRMLAYEELGQIKAEPLEAAIPRPANRLSGAFAHHVKVEDGHCNGLNTPPSKRSRLETPKTPLTLVNRASPVTTATPSASPSTTAENNAEDIREKLSEVQAHISSIEAKLYRADAKPNKAKTDVTRINRFRIELAELRILKDKYTAALPSSLKPLSRTGSSVRYQPQMQSQFPVAGPSSNVAVPVPPAYYNTAYQNISAMPAPLAATGNLDVNYANAMQQQNMYHLPPPPAYGSHVYAEDGNMPHADRSDEDNGEGIPQFENLMADVAGRAKYDADDPRFDNDGDFYGRGKDAFNGPVAKADDIEKFLITAGNAEQFDGNESMDKALEKLGLPDIYSMPPGMAIPLMPHQVIGVAWMLEKERGEHKGGCLADEMGLGKTIQMIATIVMNRMTNPQRETTLIVSPLALLDQWQQEIEMKTNLGLKCHIYHGSGRVKRPEDLRGYDIVLTTYQTLAFEWPLPDDEAEEREKKRRKKNQDARLVDEEEDRKRVRRDRTTPGPLFGVPWYVCPISVLLRVSQSLCRDRVVLDEGQNIRNRRTRASRAVTELDATYRWCLTGTPIINALADAYGLLRFLRIRPWWDWREFNQRITLHEKKNPSLATKRLQTIFANVLLRRKKDSKLNGLALIALPNKDVRLVKLELSKEERDIYNMVETKSQEIFNRFLRAGTVLKNYHQVLVMLLRLRQICAHPSLITEGGEAFALPGEHSATAAKVSELQRAERLIGADFVMRMKEKFRVIALERMAAEKESADATLEGDDYECPICFDSYTDAILTPCGHIFCGECITNVLNSQQRLDGGQQNQYGPEERPCPSCRGAICKDKLFSCAVFEPTDAELNGDNGSSAQGQDVEMADATEKPKAGRLLRKRRTRPRFLGDSDDGHDDDDDLWNFIVDDEYVDSDNVPPVEQRHPRAGKGKGRAVVLSDDESDDEDIIHGAKDDQVPLSEAAVKMMPKFLPSTKMKYMMDNLRAWAEAHPRDKVLIISQWTSCLQLVSHYLTENQFLHVKYQGDMIRSKRDQAVRVFMAKDKATIMLMSMKCGGVGLNLTRANRVISLDLGWSEAIEAQAFDRVHRLGQTKEVIVERVVIADTVEDRILALQQRKKSLADHSLGEGSGKKVGRLSVKELANLFGLSVHGERL